MVTIMTDKHIADIDQIARDIYKKFPKQAEADEINLRIKELEQIVSGADRVIVEKQSEYEIRCSRNRKTRYR